MNKELITNNFLSVKNEINTLEENIILYSKLIERKQQELEFNKGSIKCFHISKSINEYITFVDNFYNAKSWIISNQEPQSRIAWLKSKDLFQKAKQQFESNLNMDKDVSEEQILSIFDTMSLMYKLINNLSEEVKRKQIYIIMEYQIPTKQKLRIDYMLICDDLMILIEFSQVHKIEQLLKAEKSKKEQINEYKNELINIFNIESSKIKVSTVLYTTAVFEYKDNITEENLNNCSKLIEKSFTSKKTLFEILRDF